MVEQLDYTERLKMTQETVLIAEYNVETGAMVQRQMTADELTQWELDKAETEAKAQAKTTKATARAAILDRLGLTAEEAALLLS
jgi:hypothetical protein